MRYDKWMEDLYQKIGNVPLNKIFLPATHNSGCYILNTKKPVGTTSFKLFNMMSKPVKPMKKITSDWALTQDGTVYDQLGRGVRMLDLRLCYSEKDDNFYISNKFTCIDLITVLNDINRFLDNSTYEFIFLNVRVDKKHKETINFERKTKALNLVKGKFENRLLRSAKIMPTYHEILQGPGRIVLYFEDVYDDEFVWLNETLVNPKLKTISTDAKYDFLISEQKKFIPDNLNLNILGFYIQPKKDEINKEVRNRVLKKWKHKKTRLRFGSEQLQDRFYEIIASGPTEHGKPSVFMTDYPTERFINTVVNMN